jgi:hypothetical protein
MNARAIRIAVFACAAAMSSGLGAQQPASDTLIVRGFPLQYLTNADAAKLVSPYVLSSLARAGVFEAGGAVHAITVRAPAGELARVDSILRANDRQPATVTLRLQVIAASDSAVRDASIGELEAELHNLFRFNGYRLLSQGSVTVNDGSSFEATMRGPNGDQLTVFGLVSGVRRGGNRAVQLQVSLSHKARRAEMVAGLVQSGVEREELLQTGLSIPIGQTVVVGSATSGGPTPAIILTVRPELATKP